MRGWPPAGKRKSPCSTLLYNRGMAAAIVPGITSLLPVVVPALVQGVEHLFGSKTGPAKLQTVLDALKAILGNLGKAGLTTAPPSDEALVALIETVVQDLKSKNLLPAPPGTPAVTSLSGMSFNVSGVLKVVG